MSTTTDRYFEAVGRRKRASARVRLFKADTQSVIINDLPIDKYFASPVFSSAATEPLDQIEASDNFKVSVKVTGSGKSSQADAIKLGIARALLEYNEDFKTELSQAGFLKRDPRSKERKKFGLRKARKRPQWSKR